MNDTAKASQTPAKQYPYQNLSLKSIRGEKWEDIPGLDGYFCLSSFGRIKRLEFETQYKDGRIVLRKEKIIRSYLIYSKNRFKKDKTPFLTAKVKLEGTKYSFSVQRLVYHLFVAPLDLEDHRIVILCKDTNNLNIRPSNLYKADIHKKQQRVVARGRMRSPLLDLSESVKISVRQKIIKQKSIQVSMYNLQGNKLRTFSSMAAAERKTGIRAQSIRDSANKTILRAGGYYWQFGKEPVFNIAGIKSERRKDFIEKWGQKLTQYDSTGTRVAIYSAVKEASEASGANINAINKVLKGEYKSAKGFIWKKGTGPATIDLKDYKWGKAAMATTQSKPVTQFSLDGKKLNTFNSVKTAAESASVSAATLSGALNGKQKSCGGFVWKFDCPNLKNV